MRLDELLQGKEAVITDLDGTIVDLGIDWDFLRERIRREMGWDHPLKPLGPNIPKAARNKAEEEAAFRIVEEVEQKASESAEFNSKIVEIFKRMKERGLKVALVTLQARKPAITTLGRLGILGFFDAIVTRELSLDRKEQLRIAIKELGVRPEGCLFFGDTQWDIEAGRELGCEVVCVG
ncbi:MAG: HAD family phosphatase, partial [Candidatus Korarchaeum sp.]|nr:HAD family phosphatase [Candidatus Korarchaeum sp.]